jgi:hypothetical protein
MTKVLRPENAEKRPMKIICLEEHTHDAAVAKATLHAAAKQAPYMADLGSEYQEEPSRDRPSLQAPKRAVELASEPVENRLSAMDADRIDMQVLSDSNSTPGPIMKPSDTLLILVSKSPRSLSSHVAEPFSAHSGHVTGVTNRSRFAIVASRPMLLHTSLPLCFRRQHNAVCNIGKAITPFRQSRRPACLTRKQQRGRAVVWNS